MASLQEIKNRINSITATKKITQAMKLVASAKLRKSKKKLESIQEYCSSIEEIFKEVKSQTIKINKINKNINKNIYIVITSDIGLCGSYNINVLKLLKKNIKKNDEIIIVGNKGISSLKSQHIKTILDISNIGDEIDYQYASQISKKVLSLFQTNQVKKIKFIYTKFINSISFEPTLINLFPFKKEENKINKKNLLIEFEPNTEVVLKNIIPLYISSSIFKLLVESKVSEMSSRRLAMDNSTDNAKELIEILKLEYNRIRQSSITQEINEIIAGSDSK